MVYYLDMAKRVWQNQKQLNYKLLLRNCWWLRACDLSGCPTQRQKGFQFNYLHASSLHTVALLNHLLQPKVDILAMDLILLWVLCREIFNFILTLFIAPQKNELFTISMEILIWKELLQPCSPVIQYSHC